MTKTTFIYIIFLIIISLNLLSCSSTSQKKYEQNEMEGRADEYSALGDKFRNEKKYIEAEKYYQTAADLYILKGIKKKYLLTRLKKALLLIKRNEIKSFNKNLLSLKSFNQIENLGLDRPIKYLEARYLYHRGNISKANELIKELVSLYDNEKEIEQKIYYHFFLASKNLQTTDNKKRRKLKNRLSELEELYNAGELYNIEVLAFARLTMSKLYLEHDHFEQAKKQIVKTDNLYRNLELTSKRDQILQLYIELYKKQNNLEKLKHYQTLLINFKKLNKIYN